MAGPTVTYTVSPTGGAIVLNIQLGNSTLNVYTTPITISRYAGSLAATPDVIYNNQVYTPVYFDAGDGLQTYLNFTIGYYYKVTDPTGTTTIGPILPSPQVTVFSNYLDGLLFKLFSAGINGVTVPHGFRPIKVLQAMPLSMGSEATNFPFVVMNLDLQQQDSLEIGENVLSNTQSNLNVLPTTVMRRYSINVVSHNAQERDFYKDSCIDVCYATMLSLINIGQGFTYDVQASNSQSSDGSMLPGFYVSVIMLEFIGQFNISVTTNLPFIESINPVLSVTPSPSGTIIVI